MYVEMMHSNFEIFLLVHTLGSYFASSPKSNEKVLFIH